jgi:hypothetical protein
MGHVFKECSGVRMERAFVIGEGLFINIVLLMIWVSSEFEDRFYK